MHTCSYFYSTMYIFFALIPGSLPLLIDVMEFCEGLHILEITVLNEDNRYVSDKIEFIGGLSGT